MRSNRFNGVVIKVTAHYITILCKDGNFKNMPRSKNEFPQLGDSYTISEKQFPKGEIIKKYLSLVAILFLTVMSYYISTFMTKDESYLFAIDINPSIEIYTDADLNVTKVNSLNEDGQLVMDSIAYKYKQIDIVLEEIITAAVKGDYLKSENAQVDVTVVSLTEKNDVDINKVKETIDQSLITNATTATVQVKNGSKELVEDAREANLSINKLQLYNQEIQGIEVQPEELSDNSITKVNEDIKKEQIDSEKKKSVEIEKANKNSSTKIEKAKNDITNSQIKREDQQVNKPDKVESNRQDKLTEAKKEEKKPVEVNKPKTEKVTKEIKKSEKAKEKKEQQADKKEMQVIKKDKTEVDSEKNTLKVEKSNIENSPEKKGKSPN